MIFQAKTWNIEQLLCLFLFANSQHRSTHFRACPSMSWDHATVFAWGISHPGNFSVAPAEIRDSNIFENSSMFSFGLHSRWVHPKYKGSGHEVGSPRSTSFINSFHMGLKFCFRPVILMSSTCAEKNNPCFLCTNRHSQFGILPIRVPIELPRSVFPITILPMGDHTHFVQDEPQDLQCLPKTSATCVVEERIHTSGHYPSQSGNLAMTSIHYFCGSHLGRTNPAGKTARLRAVFHSPRSTTRLMSINVTKWTFFLSLLCYEKNLLLTLDFSSCHAGIFSIFPTPWTLLPLHP